MFTPFVVFDNFLVYVIC